MNRQDSIDTANEQIRAIDKHIALKSAALYTRQVFPAAVLVWGSEENPPEPDEIDQVWELPRVSNESEQFNSTQNYLVITATAGELELKERQSKTGMRYCEGSRPYLQYAIWQLRQYGQSELAARLDQALFLARLRYLHLHTPIETVNGRDRVSTVEAQQFDLSDDQVVAQGIEAVRRLDSSQIESLRQQFSAKGLETLTAQYWQLENWDEKAMLIYLVCDNQRPILKAMMEDTLLNMPDVDDSTQWARATAVCYFEGKRDRFSSYYNDDNALKAAIAQLKQQLNGDPNV